MEHISVLKKQVQNYLNLIGGEYVMDATLGLGGHARDILEKIGPEGKLIAFEQDERNLREAEKRLKSHENQITYCHENFRYLKKRITGESLDAALFDLGLSSPHVDLADRGFSFSKEADLDMRFDTRKDFNAATVLNTYPENELARVFWEYGEERASRKLARMIVERRKRDLFSKTTELAEFIEKVYPAKRSSKASKVHPATKVFQALRIEVNDELEVLKEALEDVFGVLKPGGRLVVISYHSLEDRIVKNFFRDLEKPEPNQEQAIYSNYGEALAQILTKKPVVPTEEELKENPRSRSAKLRAIKKLKNKT